jgi:2-keto-4-pentenoate hydratase/2-oxohepta-3-ene-1,7-dioic acid hydratase in catechol pathway
MHIVRFTTQGKVKYGALVDNFISGITGNPFSITNSSRQSLKFDHNSYLMSEVKLLAPCQPTKIVAVGLNYHSHATEVKLSVPTVPLIFLKPSTAVIGPDETIILPPTQGRVDYEGELGVVIGKRAKNVHRDEAKNYVFGYTCVNDVSERHIQKADGQWTRAKGFDTFAPIGPWIETGIDPDDLKIGTYLNGELRQSARTSDLIFGIYELIEFISAVMTLLPGDVISTGTPSGIGRMNPGDVVEVKIEKIGTLKNYVSV